MEEVSRNIVQISIADGLAVITNNYRYIYLKFHHILSFLKDIIFNTIYRGFCRIFFSEE